MHPRPRPQATKRKSATNRSTLEGKTAVGIVLSGVHDCKNAIIRHWRMTLYFETCIWTFFSVLSVLTLCHPLCTQLSSELYLCKLRFLAAFSHSSDLNSEMVWNRKEKKTSAMVPVLVPGGLCYITVSHSLPLMLPLQFIHVPASLFVVVPFLVYSKNSVPHMTGFQFYYSAWIVFSCPLLSLFSVHLPEYFGFFFLQKTVSSWLKEFSKLVQWWLLHLWECCYCETLLVFARSFKTLTSGLLSYGICKLLILWLWNSTGQDEAWDFCTAMVFHYLL